MDKDKAKPKGQNALSCLQEPNATTRNAIPTATAKIESPMPIKQCTTTKNAMILPITDEGISLVEIRIKLINCGSRTRMIEREYGIFARIILFFGCSGFCACATAQLLSSGFLRRRKTMPHARSALNNGTPNASSPPIVDQLLEANGISLIKGGSGRTSSAATAAQPTTCKRIRKPRFFMSSFLSCLPISECNGGRGTVKRGFFCLDEV